MVFQNKTLNSLIIEDWINETLKDAEWLNIPGVILKPEQKKPISRYNIDRHFLIEEGLNKALIDRIYRSLFVFSIGFNDIIRMVVSHAKHSFTTTTYIWKAFSVLLEYSCQVDHKMMIEHAEELNKEEINRYRAEVQDKFDGNDNSL